MFLFRRFWGLNPILLRNVVSSLRFFRQEYVKKSSSDCFLAKHWLEFNFSNNPYKNSVGAQCWRPRDHRKVIHKGVAVVRRECNRFAGSGPCYGGAATHLAEGPVIFQAEGLNGWQLVLAHPPPGSHTSRTRCSHTAGCLQRGAPSPPCHLCRKKGKAALIDRSELKLHAVEAFSFDVSPVNLWQHTHEKTTFHAGAPTVFVAIRPCME